MIRSKSALETIEAVYRGRFPVFLRVAVAIGAEEELACAAERAKRSSPVKRPRCSGDPRSGSAVSSEGFRSPASLGRIPAKGAEEWQLTAGVSVLYGRSETGSERFWRRPRLPRGAPSPPFGLPGGRVRSTGRQGLPLLPAGLPSDRGPLRVDPGSHPGAGAAGGSGPTPDQCRNWRRWVKTIAAPARLAASITSASRLEPPGWTIVATPASRAS